MRFNILLCPLVTILTSPLSRSSYTYSKKTPNFRPVTVLQGGSRSVSTIDIAANLRGDGLKPNEQLCLDVSDISKDIY
jgi:hypothetical protein